MNMIVQGGLDYTGTVVTSDDASATDPLINDDDIFCVGSTSQPLVGQPHNVNFNNFTVGTEELKNSFVQQQPQ